MIAQNHANVETSRRDVSHPHLPTPKFVDQYPRHPAAIAFGNSVSTFVDSLTLHSVYPLPRSVARSRRSLP